MNNLIESANVYSNFGLSVIPTKEDKSPAVKWAPFQDRRMMNGEIESNFSNPNSSGIGIICGRVSGNLEVIDIDCKYDITGQLAKAFFDLVKYNTDIFDKLVIVKTKNAGWHVYYKCSIIQGNQKLALNSKNEVLFETRGEGGYVIAPPSHEYTFKRGSFENIPKITPNEREILFAIAKSFDETITEKSQANDSESNAGLSPFDDYNNRGDVVGLLEKHGWTFAQQSGDRVMLTRPGKEDGSVSGNWHLVKRIFYVFSTSSQFDALKGYNAVGVYSLLECYNDFSEASRRLYDDGYGDRKITPKGSEKGSRKDEPTPLLPIEGFPTRIQNIINTCVDVYQTPRDFWVASAIAATALAIGDKLELKTRYVNIPIFWICNVGDVSSGKTEPQKLLLKPFQELDDESFKDYKANRNEYERITGLSKKEREAEGIDKIKEPSWFQYRIKDATPEALAAIHEINQRGLIIDREELKGWIDDFGRYNKSGEQSNMLSTWSQVSYVCNRKGSKPINIAHPVINVFGGIQPDLLPTLALDNRAENGFVSRMCFAFPDFSKKQEYQDSVIPQGIYEEWKLFLVDLTKIPETVTLSLTNDAQEKYRIWFNDNAALTNIENIQHLKGVYGKLDIIVLRLAIVLKGMKLIMEGDCEETISGDIMQSAIDIAEYFRATALKVYEKMFANEKKKTEKADVIKWVFSNLPQRTKTEISKFFETSRSQVNRIEDRNNL